MAKSERLRIFVKAFPVKKENIFFAGGVLHCNVYKKEVDKSSRGGYTYNDIFMCALHTERKII